MSLFPESIVQLGRRRNIMREIREYGLIRAREVGADNVFDFSLGNPSVPAPAQVNDTIRALLSGTEGGTVHSYTSAQGDLETRETLAASLTRRFGMDYRADDFYLTAGASAALCCCFRALACPGDEFLLLAPYFTEYDGFVRGNGGIPVVVPPDTATLQPDLDALERAVTAHTKALVINSPNNPSGVVYTAETLQRIADLLRRKSAEYGRPIYIISDEPYREIVFEGFSVPWLPALYDNTLVCYSYSKSLSLPGERIGYVLVGERVAERTDLYAAICGAGRVLGYVNAPSLFQRVAAACDGMTADLTVYQTNRDLLYQGLTGMGYTCAEPGGTFYLLLKAPIPDAGEFCRRAQALDLLFPPTDDFGCPGWCRIAFCTETDRVERALPLFQTLAKQYGL